MEKKIIRSDEEWRQLLSEEEYRIMRKSGTEAPFTGQYNLHFEQGVYTCKGCKTPLFTSEAKFNSHCGWPSFDAEAQDGIVEEKLDMSHGMVRSEILCSVCGSHLGHVFPDGPTDTGLRYCVNSASLGFEKQ